MRTNARTGWVLLVISGLWTAAAGGCGESRKAGGGNSETHFLATCQASCGAGFECLCGVCTRACEDVNDCSGLAANAECVATCDGASAPRACDVPCTASEECNGLGAEFSCDGGRCRSSAGTGGSFGQGGNGATSGAPSGGAAGDEAVAGLGSGSGGDGAGEGPGGAGTAGSGSTRAGAGGSDSGSDGGDGGAGGTPLPPDPECVNGGSIARLDDGSGVCSCPAGFWGETCEVTTAKLELGQGACALLSNGTVRCWGRVDDFRDSGIGEAPPGSFVELWYGPYRGCAADSAGELSCWGSDSYGESTPPSGAFTSVVLGSTHTCGLKPDDTIECWGDNSLGATAAPSGQFKSLAVNGSGNCAVGFDNNVTCWGSLSATPPAEEFEALTFAGSNCGLRPDHSIECFAWSEAGDATPPSGNSFTFVESGFEHICALDSLGTATCWGANTQQELEVPARSFASISVSGQSACGLTTEGEIACWGRDSLGETHAPSGRVADFGAGRSLSCALDAQGNVECWGMWGRVAGSGLSGQFDAISVGGSFACGLEAGAVSCTDALDEPVPSGTYKTVAAGDDHACAIRTDDTLACWGVGATGGALPPSGRYISVAAGDAFSCAIAENGALACWGGDNGYGELEPPSGTFTRVDAEYRHACALSTDGSIVCWGDTLDGVAAPTSSVPFESLSVGLSAVCGLTTQKRIVCAGNAAVVETTAPDRTFARVIAGPANICGLTERFGLACWGYEERPLQNEFEQED